MSVSRPCAETSGETGQSPRLKPLDMAHIDLAHVWGRFLELFARQGLRTNAPPRRNLLLLLDLPHVVTTGKS